MTPILDKMSNNRSEEQIGIFNLVHQVHLLTLFKFAFVSH